MAKVVGVGSAEVDLDAGLAFVRSDRLSHRAQRAALDRPDYEGEAA